MKFQIHGPHLIPRPLQTLVDRDRETTKKEDEPQTKEQCVEREIDRGGVQHKSLVMGAVYKHSPHGAQGAETAFRFGNAGDSFFAGSKSVSRNLDRFPIKVLIATAFVFCTSSSRLRTTLLPVRDLPRRTRSTNHISDSPEVCGKKVGEGQEGTSTFQSHRHPYLVYDFSSRRLLLLLLLMLSQRWDTELERLFLRLFHLLLAGFVLRLGGLLLLLLGGFFLLLLAQDLLSSLGRLSLRLFVRGLLDDVLRLTSIGRLLSSSFILGLFSSPGGALVLFV